MPALLTRTSRRALPALGLPLGLLSLLIPTGVVLVGAFERRWLDDDGFINLRIVRNLLNGNGPVFNLGERVEAGTSPLWVGLVALLGSLGFRLEDASVYLGIVLTGLSLLLAQDAASRLYAAPLTTRGERLRQLFLPLGALTVSVLPPVWDYASGGLETSLSFVWLAGAYNVLLSSLGRGQADARNARRFGSALLLGLGNLVRPELSLYALAFFALFLINDLRAARSGRERALRLVSLGATFAFLPLSYQLFRMGFYGALTPNTAIAKEASLVNWHQGRCYLRNFIRPYKLLIPLLSLGALLAGLVYTSVRSERAERVENERQGSERTDARMRWAAMGLPPAVAALHALYVVRMGGDYMHARMLLPALFAALLPVSVVPAFSGDPVRRGLIALCGPVVIVWALVCASSFRVAVENVCDIGDERGWYAREAQVPNPVRLEDYDKHMFVTWGRGLVETVRATCPKLDTMVEGSTEPGCRLVHLGDEEAREVYPMRKTYPMASTLDARLLGVISQGAIGMAGFLLPDNVYLADIHGLADPLVARALLETRGRPGHEKTLPTAWLLARFAEPLPEGEDARVGAARHALHCGALADLQHAVRDPLDLSAFLDNVRNARSNTTLRIPRDPFAAEAQLCGGSPLTLLGTAGDGGDEFHWRCPAGQALTRISGSFDTPGATIASVEGSCAEAGTGPKAAGTRMFGGRADAPFELSCPAGSDVVGLFGTREKAIRSLGLVCANGLQGAPTRTPVAGLGLGEAFELLCPKGQRARSLRGRAGALIDAVGIGCEAPPAP